MDTAKRHAQLTARMEELTARLDRIDDELEAPHSKDWEEQAAEREGDEVLEDLGEAGRAELAQIRAALGRIESGDYGICMRCGEEISEERLDALPATPFCRRCAA